MTMGHLLWRRQAADEYLQENRIQLFLTRLDAGLYMGVKQSDTNGSSAKIM